MGCFDTVVVEHDCPKCGREMAVYQTKALGQNMGAYRLEDAINIGYGPDFEFEIHDYCDPCKISISAFGIVRDNKFMEVKETGYFDEGAPPITLYDEHTELPCWKTGPETGERTPGIKTIYPREQPFVPNQRIIASCMGPLEHMRQELHDQISEIERGIGFSLKKHFEQGHDSIWSGEEYFEFMKRLGLIGDPTALSDLILLGRPYKFAPKARELYEDMLRKGYYQQPPFENDNM